MTLADIIKTATALGYQPTRRTAFRRNVALRLDCRAPLKIQHPKLGKAREKF